MIARTDGCDRTCRFAALTTRAECCRTGPFLRCTPPLGHRFASRPSQVQPPICASPTHGLHVNNTANLATRALAVTHVALLASACSNAFSSSCATVHAHTQCKHSWAHTCGCCHPPHKQRTFVTPAMTACLARTAVQICSSENGLTARHLCAGNHQRRDSNVIDDEGGLTLHERRGIDNNEPRRHSQGTLTRGTAKQLIY